MLRQCNHVALAGGRAGEGGKEGRQEGKRLALLHITVSRTRHTHQSTSYMVVYCTFPLPQHFLLFGVVDKEEEFTRLVDW